MEGYRDMIEYDVSWKVLVFLCSGRVKTKELGENRDV